MFKNKMHLQYLDEGLFAVFRLIITEDVMYNGFNFKRSRF